MRYYSESQIGATRARTPEGFLICADVPIARTGVQKYDAFEIDEVAPGDDGTIDMERPEGEVFSPATIASFEGKPVTNDHPDGEMVNPGNWREHLVGHVQNVRRGSGAQRDLLLGDLFINDPRAIDDILSGKVEVSCGYDHEVEVVARGRGRQTQIVGNHVALVDAGRCGPRCAIGDSGMTKKGKISDWLRKAFRARDSAEFAKIAADAEGDLGGVELPEDAASAGVANGEHQVHIHLAPASADKGKKDDDEENEEDSTMSKDAISAVNKRMDSIEGSLGKVVDAIAKLAGRGRSDRRRPDDMNYTEAEDEEDPMLADAEREEETEDEGREEETAEARKKREDARRRDDFGAAPGKRSGSKILGALEFSDPLGDGARREDRRAARREAGARDARAMDSNALRETFDGVLADAEIIAPGVKLMTFDARAPRAVTMDRICAFRRRVLSAAMDDDDGRALIVDVNGGDEPDLRRASCDSVKLMFGAAATVRRKSGEVRAPSRIGGRDTGKSMIQKMQEANDKFWKAST